MSVSGASPAAPSNVLDQTRLKFGRLGAAVASARLKAAARSEMVVDRDSIVDKVLISWRSEIVEKREGIG